MGLDMYVRDSYGNEIAYWRKFNALHAWFVNRLQDGKDDCQPSRSMNREDVEQILYILKSIKEVPSTARFLLPTTKGFFFGSTEYEDYFLDNVTTSIPEFEKILEMVNNGESLYYISSW